MQIEPVLNLANTVLQAGADALFLNVSIASQDVLTHFVNQYSLHQHRLPLIVQLEDFTGGETTLLGVQAAVYGNQLLPAALAAMQETAVSLLQTSQEETTVPATGQTVPATSLPQNKQ
jgi:2-methylisocitrate lyase-like PEP mutase family enzyme